MTHDEAIKTIREALSAIHPIWKEFNRGYSDYGQGYSDALDACDNIVHPALAALDSLALEPSEDALKLVNAIRGDIGWHTGMMAKDEVVALIIARDERIRRECADRAIEYIATGNYGSDAGLRAAIMGVNK